MHFNKKIIFILVVALLISDERGFTQNLTPNFSFELYDTCPNALGQLNFAYPWFRPTLGTSDYYNACFDTLNVWIARVDVPNNIIGNQFARTGDGYCGIIVYIYNPNSREYIEAKLDSPLIGGVTYYVKFYVSRSDSCIWAVDAIGAYFSEDSILSTNWNPLPYIPQIANPVGNLLTDRSTWTEISGSFIAQGGEKYITIGNFKNDISTDTMSVPGGNPTPQGYRFSYYYVDDICVSSDSMYCKNLSGLFDLNQNRKFEIYPNPSKGEVIVKKNARMKVDLEFYDSYGKMVLKKMIPVNDIEFKLDLTFLNNGLYIIKSNYFRTQILINK